MLIGLILLEGIPTRPYIVRGNRVLPDTISGVLPEYILDSFLLFRLVLLWYEYSSTTVRVVTTDVGHGPCPTPYPRIRTPCAQSRDSESDKPRALRSRVLQASEYFWRRLRVLPNSILKVSSNYFFGCIEAVRCPYPEYLSNLLLYGVRLNSYSIWNSPRALGWLEESGWGSN
jgi:hypothetical protein